MWRIPKPQAFDLQRTLAILRRSVQSRRSLTLTDCTAPGARYVGPMNNDHTPLAPPPPAALLTTSEAAQRARCSPRTLHDLRYYGLGPPAQKLPNGRLMYDERKLTDWIAALPGPIYQTFDWTKLAKKRSGAKTQQSRTPAAKYKYSQVNVKRGKWSLRTVAS